MYLVDDCPRRDGTMVSLPRATGAAMVCLIPLMITLDALTLVF
jgi:hypothetical protein